MKPLRWLQACACLVTVSTVASPLSAQFGYFGQNKIQYRKFDWRVLRGEHVDLYYYPEEEELGRVALAYAEESYDNLERRFNHAVTRRVPLIVYASHTDFEQTNILPFIPPEGLLGVTEFLKRRVALPFRGSYAEFRHTIRHELVHVFQLSLQSQTFGRYPRFRQVGMPLWWTEGLAEFFSAGADSRDEMVLRDMTIYGQTLAARSRRRPVVQGERSEQFESFHFFESRIDVNAQGVAAFSSKYAERDALFFWDLRKSKVVGRYQFNELVSILSPTWAPDGKSVVFSGLSVSGYSDLYRFWLADPGDSLGAGRLERLTSDRYEDLDPTVSPDGRTVVFSSDRTPFGKAGAHNLFALDLPTGAIRYLTYGNWRDEAPRWGQGRVYFASDRGGAFQIYSIDSVGNGRREVGTLNGAFDPQWVPGEYGGLLFGGFADLTFNIYVAPPLPPSDTASRFTLAVADSLPAASWTWGELSHPQYARTDGTPYERKFSLDFAAGDAAVAPGLGSAHGG